MLANHKDGFIRKRGIRVNLKRGDIGWSERELADRWKWSRGKVRRFLSELCSENESKMVQQTVQQNKFITSRYHIVNYNLYQGDGTVNSTANGPQTDRKRYQKKNVKNDKNTYTSDFEIFWAEYPNKTGKGGAFKIWKRDKLKSELQLILNALKWQTVSDKWKEENGRFIPHPSTYLNQRRWEDEPPKTIYNETADEYKKRKAKEQDEKWNYNN